jgi:transcriptional regulator with XRE-family HTH domain
MRRYPISDQLRQILIDARHAKGLKQTELAKLLGRSQAFVSNYERGQRRIDVAEFIEIAGAVGLDPVEVITRLG